MGHLKRIILIHTHLQSVVELCLDAHANICGTNAAGKTTLQRLIPVFYGELPSRVVPRTRKAFHRFYLPHANSYLIYEYLRESGETALAVLTRHPQDGIEYRFVASPYRSELFLQTTDQGPQGVDYGAWIAQLREAGIDYSRKLEVTAEYRAIVLNDLTALTGDRSEQARLRQLALRYSLVTPGHRLRHIEKLVSAVHARAGKMQTLKIMLAAIFEDDGVELPVTRLRRDQAREWVRAMRQALNLENLRGQMQRWQETGRALVEVETQLARMVPSLTRDLAHQRQQLADAEAALQGIDRQLRAAVEAHQEEHGRLQNRQLDLQQDAAKTRRALADLQQRHGQYMQDDFAGLEHDTQALPAWRQDLRTLQEQLALLQAQAGTLQRAFDHQKAEQLQQLQARQQASEQQTNQVRAELDSLRQHHRQALDAQAQAHEAQREAARQGFDQRQTALIEQASEIKAELRGDFLTDTQRRGRDQAQARIEREQQAAGQAAEALSQKQEALRRAAHAHEQAVRGQQTLERTRRQQEEVCQRLQHQLEPAAGTLRRFLRDEQTGWEVGIGKVLRAELLERKDLAPQRDDRDVPGAPGTNLFGIQLDLSRVETPDYALDDVATRQALEAAQAALESARKEETANDGQARALEAARKKADQAAEAARREHARAQAEVGYAQAARDTLQQEIKAQAAARQRDCMRRQEELAQVQQALAAEKAQQLQALKAAQQAEQQQLRREQDGAAAVHTERLDRIQRDLRTQQEDVAARQRELEARLHADMADAGIDTAALTRAEARIKDKSARIQQVEQRADALREYQHFMRVEWQQARPQWQQRAATLAAELQTVAQAIAAEAARDTQQRAALRQQNQRWQAQKKQSAHWTERLQPLVARLEHLRLGPGIEQPVRGDAATDEANQGEAGQDERLARAQDAEQAHAERTRQMDAQRQQLNRELTASGDADFIGRLNYNLRELERDGPPHPAAYLPLYEKLLILLGDQQTELTQQGRNMGGDLNKFFTVFRDLDRRIAAQSRRLSDEVRDELPLEGISKAEVRISSTIDELEFWEPLTRFSALYTAWDQSGREAPDEAYLAALAQVAELLRQDQAYRFEDLLRLELRLSEGGNELVITNDQQLLESSSHGMAYLILCRFLLAFTRLLRRDAQVAIHWPIDEIGTLAYGNVERLFRACDQNHILVLGAFPNAESDVLQLFKYRYLIERTAAGGERRELKRIEPRVSPLAEKLMHLQQQAQSTEQPA